MSREIKNLKINLDSDILNSDNVFVLAHNGIDLDGVGAAVGFSEITKKLGKESLIVVDDADINLDTLVKKIISDKCQNIKFINKEKCLSMLSGNDLLVVVDTNRKSRISLGDSLDKFGNIYVFDHHEISNDTINTDNLYIYENASSASEVITDLIRLNGIKIDDDVATVLLAGINLDTANYSKGRTLNMVSTVNYLMKRGGDDEYITRLFMRDYLEDMKMYEVVSRKNTEFRTFIKENLAPVSEVNTDTNPSFNATYGVFISVSPEINGRITLAKAADFLLQYADASIVLSNIDENTISVHGRSKGEINIGNIFEKIGGGGSSKSAATIMRDISLDCAKEKVLGSFPTLSEAKKFI